MYSFTFASPLRTTLFHEISRKMSRYQFAAVHSALNVTLSQVLLQTTVALVYEAHLREWQARRDVINVSLKQ